MKETTQLIIKQEAQLLEDQVREHQKRYDTGQPTISDRHFDLMLQRLYDIKPDSPVLDQLGSAVTETTATHQSKMLSLDKVYSLQDLRKWCEKVLAAGKRRQMGAQPFIVQPKYDGVALSIEYRAHNHARAITRGDGACGDDVTAALHWIGNGIPKSVFWADNPANAFPIVVRGELVLAKKAFERTWKGRGYANPRNAIAGALVSRGSNAERRAILKDATFVAYQTLPDSWALSEDLKALKARGFYVGPWIAGDIAYVLSIVGNATPEYFGTVGIDMESDKVLDFEIDGIVIKANLQPARDKMGFTAHHPRWAMAFKFQGDSGFTTLKEVEWEVSRTGTITPVAVFDPLQISGATVERATLHHVERLEELCLSPGSQIVVTRRGGVIPHVERATVDAPEGAGVFGPPRICPACLGAAQREGKFLLCSQRMRCPAARRGQLEHWAHVTGMLGWGPGLIERAYDVGALRTPVDFYRLDAKKAGRAGLGPKQTENLIEEANRTSKMAPHVFLAALGIDFLGETLAKKLLSVFGFRTILKRPVTAGSVVGDKRWSAIRAGLEANEDLIDTLLEYVTVEAEAPQTGPLHGVKVVFTGALSDMDRETARALVRQLGGETPNSVTKDTSYLVVGDLANDNQTSKRDRAAQYNLRGARIAIIDEAAFAQLIAAAQGDKHGSEEAGGA